MTQVVRLVTDKSITERKLSGWQEDDDTFFHKRQIRQGVQLRYFGRRDHGAIWVIEEIWTHHPAAVRRRSTANAAKLSDTVILKKLGSNQSCEATVGYLSYSSIWRLA